MESNKPTSLFFDRGTKRKLEHMGSRHTVYLGAVSHWMARDIHFFSGYPVFGLEEGVDRDSQIQRIYPQKCG
jgi:hypothetical protein